jgi:ankyrin repeat protein
MWLSFLQKQIAQAPPASLQKASRSAQLLVSRGLIKNEVKDDLNADGEGVLVRAGGDGWPIDSIDAAICAGADVQDVDSEERSGVWLAASYGHLSSMKALLSAGCSVHSCWRRYNVLPVYIASCNGHAACLKLLLDAGGDHATRNIGGCSPCWTAASYGNAECLAILIAARADFNQCDNQGRSPLYMAANSNRAACLAQLIAAGADARSCHNDVSALEICRQKGHCECAAILAAALQHSSEA